MTFHPKERRGHTRRDLLQRAGGTALGLSGAGSLLVYHSDSEAAAAWALLRPFAHLPVHLGAGGFRRET